MKLSQFLSRKIKYIDMISFISLLEGFSTVLELRTFVRKLYDRDDLVMIIDEVLDVLLK